MDISYTGISFFNELGKKLTFLQKSNTNFFSNLTLSCKKGAIVKGEINGHEVCLLLTVEAYQALQEGGKLEVKSNHVSHKEFKIKQKDEKKFKKERFEKYMRSRTNI